MRNILHFIAAVIAVTAIAAGCTRSVPAVDNRMARIDSVADRYYAVIYSAPLEAARGLEGLLDSVAADSDLYYAVTPHLALARLIAGERPASDSLLAVTRRYVATSPASPLAHERLMSITAVIHSLYGRNREGADDFMLAAEYARENRNMKGAVKNLANAGELMEMSGYPARSIPLLRKAIVLADSAGVHDIDFSIITRAAATYNILGNYDEADRLYGKNLTRLPEQDHVQQFHFFSSRGNSYYYRGDYASALADFIAAQSLLTGESDPYLHAVTHSNLGECYLLLDSLDHAAGYINLAVEEFDRLAVNDVNQLFYLNSLRGALALAQGDLDRARRLLTAVDPDSVTLSPRYVALHHHRLEKYYSAIGDYRRALDHNIKAAALDDSVIHFIARNYTAELNERHRQDTTILHTRLHVAQKEEEISRLYMWISITGAILAVVILGIAAAEFVRRRRMNRLQDTLLRTRLDNARNRISPHFIFNILNTEAPTDDVHFRNLLSLMRLNLELCNRQVITLGEELDFIRTYIDVVTPSLGPGFTYVEHIGPEINPEKIRISAMLIQITVENAVKHGLMGDSDPDKKLVLSIDMTPDGYTITVENTLSSSRHPTEGTGTGLRILNQTIDTLNHINHRPVTMTTGTTSDSGGTSMFRVKIFIPAGLGYE